MKPSIVTSAFTFTLIALGLLLMGCSIRPAPEYYYEDPYGWEPYYGGYGSSDVVPLDEVDDGYFSPYEPYYSPWSMSTYYHHIPPYPSFHDKSYQGSKGSYQPYQPYQTDEDKTRAKKREFSDHTQRERYRSRVSDSESTAPSSSQLSQPSQPSQNNSNSTSTPNPNYIEDENLKRTQEEMRIREEIRERQRLREPKEPSQVDRSQSRQRQRMRSRSKDR